jgi:hypothetical protein
VPRRTARTPRRKEGVRVSVGGGDEDWGGGVQIREVSWGRGEGKGRTERR